nr:MAG TPA: hypothetical protein [Caudoviricetes sp.]
MVPRSTIEIRLLFMIAILLFAFVKSAFTFPKLLFNSESL